MTSYAAQLLNELMGSDRNTNPNDKKREIRFDDPEICKYFLCGFCPHDLFTNTRADLGTCGKLHDEEILKKYRASSRFEKMGYEEDFLRFLQSLLSEVEKRIRKGHARLSLNSTVGSMMGAPQVEREEKISMLTEKVNELVEQAEQLGCEGKVEEAQGVMKLCEQLKEERSQLQSQQVIQRPDHATTKDMEVCEICGALLVVGDAQQRIDEHIMGKQHMGYAQIRSYIEKYKQRQQGEESERMARLQKEREEREREREKERTERDERRKEREKERQKDKEDRRRHRSRSRSRDRHRRRSRSRDRRRRSRSRSRHRRSRSRDRDRDRDRRRRSRSRSHGRSRSSRDKDRRRSRSRSRRSRDKDTDREHHRDDRRSERTKESSPRASRDGTPSADKD